VTLSTEWIAEEDRFAALAEEWEAMLPADARPFDLHCWHLAWWRAFGDGSELAMVAAREEGTLVGVLPLRRRGRDLTALANVHSCVFRPLATDRAALEAAVGGALRGARSLKLIELPDGDPSLRPLEEIVRGEGMTPLREPGTVSAIVETTGDLDTWVVEEANTSWIKRVRRYRRKTNKDHEASFTMLEAPVDLEAELDAALALEARGWKGSTGTAIASRPETEAFYRDVAARFHARGELRLNRIVLDGELAAFNICIEHGRRLYALKTGFDERFKKIAPGLVMQVSIVEACFERGIDAYELLGDRADWKLNLANASRTQTTLRAYRRSPAGIARRAYRANLRPRLRDLSRRLSRSR
jgi:CelD/BcsL family acetyltransferase involved in cellulose biosynthesis